MFFMYQNYNHYDAEQKISLMSYFSGSGKKVKTNETKKLSHDHKNLYKCNSRHTRKEIRFAERNSLKIRFRINSARQTSRQEFGLLHLRVLFLINNNSSNLTVFGSARGGKKCSLMVSLEKLKHARETIIANYLLLTLPSKMP